MADEPVNGWLPPAAPGAEPRPRFEPVPEEDTPSPPPAAPPSDRPAFVRPQAAGVRDPAVAWALGLGIAGLGLLLLSLGTFFVVTVPLSAAGWALADRARKRAPAGEPRRGERQLAAALWLGRIGVIAGVLAAMIFFVLLAAGFDFEQLRDDLQRELDRQRQDSDSEGVRTALEHLRATVGGR
jgi:hypothetical protein